MNDLRQVIHTVRSLCDRVAAIESRLNSLSVKVEPYNDNPIVDEINGIKQAIDSIKPYNDAPIKDDIKKINSRLSSIKNYNDKPLVMRIEKLESFDVKAVVNLDYVNSLYRG